MRKLIISILFILGIFIWWRIYSYQVDLPNSTQNIQSEWTISSDSTSSKKNLPYFEYLVKILTTYIWLFTWVIAFWVVLYAWFLLTTSQWTPEDLKKANKMLVWWLVGIFVSLLSYLLVKVLINLF